MDDHPCPKSSGSKSKGAGLTTPSPTAGGQRPSVFHRFFRRLDTRLGTQQNEGRDTVIRLNIDVQTLFFGGECRVAFHRRVVCPQCDGRYNPRCLCQGMGRLRMRDQVHLHIPPGAHESARLRIAGKGEDGLHGSPNGDLLVNLLPPPLSPFKRNGLDLIGDLAVPWSLARFGGRVSISLPRSTVRLEIPARTKNGDRLKLTGQGVPRWGQDDVGHVYLRILIV